MADPMGRACDAIYPLVSKHDGKLILMAQSGSRAFGTDHKDSDYDFKGVYVAGLDRVLGLAGVPKTFNLTEPDDVTVYELHHFCKLAAAGNPTILEVLWSDSRRDAIGALLADNRDLFLSKRIYNTYKGFAYSQRKKGLNSRKARLHAARLLWAGAKALETHEVPVRLDPVNVAVLGLLADQSPDKFLETMTHHESMLSDAFLGSTLPEHPDEAAIDELIYNIRMKGVANAC